MNTSVLLAQIIGPIFIITALGLLFNQAFFLKVYEGVYKNNPLIYGSAILSLIIGTVLVNVHNIWDLKWTLIITIFGWLGVAKGTCLILFPEVCQRKYHLWNNKIVLYISTVIALGFGAVLVFYGYF